MILAEVVYSKFAEDSKNMLLDILEIAKSKVEEVPVEDGFAVYAKLCEVRRIYKQVFPKYVQSCGPCFVLVAHLTDIQENPIQ